VGKTVFGVIPARYASVRFPGKPLAMIGDEPMVVRVYRRALSSGIFSGLVVATEDERIISVCREHAVPAVMTRADHPSGTDRVHEAAELEEAGREADIIVNVQGDEPLIDPAALVRLVKPLETVPQNAVAASSVCARLVDQAEYHNPNVVKVVLDSSGRALYFSRAPVPFARDGGLPERVWRHIGLYAYTRPAIESFVRLPESFLERTERLEQLRLLENGVPFYMEEITGALPAVDTPEDLAHVIELIRRGKGGV